MRNMVSFRLALDEAGEGKPNFSYPVNSIYLDSDRLSTYWDWVNSNRNRYKLRLRFYDELPDTPVFFEIKRRVSNCILKQRCGVKKSAAESVLRGICPSEDQIVSRDPKARTAIMNFIQITMQIQAKPKALVTYLREAYVDPDNEGVRVTMDREVRIGPREVLDWSLHLDRYEQPFGNKVILELKFNNRFPEWFGEMVRLFNVSRSAAAKYCEGISSLQHPELGNWNTKPGDRLPDHRDARKSLARALNVRGNT